MNPNRLYTQGNIKSHWEKGEREHDGITIRDYIAIEAMKALITGNKTRVAGKEVSVEDFPAAVAERAYEYADALIEESHKK